VEKYQEIAEDTYYEQFNMEGSKHSKLLNKSVVIAFFLIKGRKVKHVEHNTNESG